MNKTPRKLKLQYFGIFNGTNQFYAKKYITRYVETQVLAFEHNMLSMSLCLFDAGLIV